MSLNVQSGGMFNTYKTQYSPETHKLLKLLMEEVKLTTAQRQQMRESLKKGEPLPSLPRRRARPSYVDENLFGIKKNYYFQKRSQEQIIHSGAYEKERYRFLERIVDLEKEKERLGNILAYGKSKKTQPKVVEKKKEEPPPPVTIIPEARIEELVKEIEDRVEFLKEMDNLGQAKVYEATIRQEIAAKLREMERLDKPTGQKYRKIFGFSKKRHTTEIDETISWKN